ncbi:hypothetical protein DEO72_LG3g589 [Vigna unguiculata]|uniref:Uncharacterized protein n=1 Tax=Vigna unguiculata TaxID=3917 RepID=A0A4D6LBY7_VIGUN|nr:hypothetical protein DEO72_LG3g589 [Vigna unguiculata]
MFLAIQTLLSKRVLPLCPIPISLDSRVVASVALIFVAPAPSHRLCRASSVASSPLRQLRRAVFVAPAPSCRLRRAISVGVLFVAQSLSAFSSSLHLGRVVFVSPSPSRHPRRSLGDSLFCSESVTL